MKIAVIYGGVSSEREVSLSTGKGVMEALKKKGHEVTGIDFHPDRLEEVIQLDSDLAFIGLHGKFGEDGRLQALLDMLKIPYIGSGVGASSLAMDKGRAKVMFEKAGIRVAEGRVIKNNELLEASPFGYPVVIKPNQEGSTIGLTIAEDQESFIAGIQNAFKYDSEVMIESYVKGKELTVSILGNDALPIIEIVPKNSYYDYESKYAPGMSEHIVPARVDQALTKKIQEWAIRAHQALGCSIYSRVDFIVPEDGSEPVILEVNTLPGMTPTSLFPDAAREVGLSYEDMIDKLVQLTLAKRDEK
ncbi:D-alanine--D-alanine ligase [Pullulanibacillus sp. KACC 23026]|uniref:D-alanine--D-alanine ligase n=1 Tax=Pullulanibacillus sp. KACC 23026 TaxID=3028315 RepID=UPI0023B0AAA1|nr:D-alanine--D-alanine ligase [Pullulanibacillus sp. KACC 23026]WEG11398.1 D-alanine--D-alanine ligase [Pullulanibacillus sp. KACC 23026]